MWGRVQGSQIFKQNSIILIRSKVMAFLVIFLSPWSPHCPRHPHVIPVIPTSSLCCPHHPHIIPKAPMWSLCGPMAVVSVVSLVVSVVSTPCCPHGPRGPHIIPIIPTSSPCLPHCPHIVPIASRRSPCGPHGCGLRGPLHCLRGLHPMLSPWSPSSPSSPCHPRHPRHPHVIPTSSRRFPHHL